METIKKAAHVLSGDTSDSSHGSRGETTAPKPGDTILLTGATGFVAGHILNSLLNAGFKVKATVHSKEKADRLMELYPSRGGDLQVVVVEDIAKEGAFDEAVQGVTGVVHAAYPHVLAKEGNQELLDQAVAGATGILSSIIQYNPDIRRVVMTSAFAAMNDQHKGNWPGHTYSEADWNPIKYQEALESTDHTTAYSASKTFAERACWDFVSRHTETNSLQPARFTLTSILLPAVIGPIAQDITTTGSINNSVADIYRLISGCENKVPMNTLWAWADVRDVADAHVAALLAQGKEAGVEDRFFAAAGTYNYHEICKIIERRFPELVREGGTPHATDEGETPYHYKVNNVRVKNELGIKLRGLEESIVDTVKSLLDYEDRTRRGETREIILTPVMTRGDEKGKSPEYKQANAPYSVGDGKTACNCGGRGDECTCAPETCACASCTKKAEQRGVGDKVRESSERKLANAPYSVGDGKTACNCGGRGDECTCSPGTCACANCTKKTEKLKGFDDKAGKESPENKQVNAPYSVGGGKTACNCGGRGDECTCSPETCACASCTKKAGQRGVGDRASKEISEHKQANDPYSVGGGKTACNCGGRGDECTCPPETCACASCTKKTEQREFSDKVSKEGEKAAEKVTEAVESEHTQQSPGAKYAKLSGKIDCYCGRGEDNCICPPETCGCRGCARKMGEVKFEREEFGTRQGGGVSLREEMMDA